MKRLAIVVALAAAVWILAGLHFVQPDEQAVVRRFGAITAAPWEPGAHLGLPPGLDRIDRIKTREVKRVSIGPGSFVAQGAGAGAAQFLTGDRNLVNLEATVQYTVRDAGAYLFRASSVDALLGAAAESVLAAELAAEPVDRVLTEGKREIGIRAAEELQRVADAYGLGVVVRSLDVRSIAPPPEVVDAFADVISALRQREQRINEADGYSRRILAEAAGEAQEELDKARAERDRLVHEAQGEAARFISLLAEYVRAPRLTAVRLYLDAMQEVLPRLRSKLVIDPGSGIDVGILRNGETAPAARESR